MDRENLKRRVEGKYQILPNGCWEWTASRNDAGYGQLNVDGVPMNASRASYIAHKGELPSHIDACHTCDNPPCVNPAHLFAGTRRVNILDARDKGRLPRGEQRAHAKLQTEDVLLIRGLVKAGIVQRAIADTFSVSVATINNIISGKAWNHVPQLTI